jgi:Trp operon repressor
LGVQLRELLETQGLRRLTGRAALDESWDFFLRFLDIKTQPLLTKGLRTLLSSTGGKAMAGRVGVVEQLLPEVAMRQRKPLGSVEELAGYVQVHQQELQALVELLHRGSGMYKTSLEELQLWLAQHQKEAQAVGGGRDAPRTQGPQ